MTKSLAECSRCGRVRAADRVAQLTLTISGTDVPAPFILCNPCALELTAFLEGDTVICDRLGGYAPGPTYRLRRGNGLSDTAPQP